MSKILIGLLSCVKLVFILLLLLLNVCGYLGPDDDDVCDSDLVCVSGL